MERPPDLAPVVAVPQKSAQMRDDMLKMLAANLFALKSEIAFDVFASERAKSAAGRKRTAQEIGDSAVVVLDRLIYQSPQFYKVSPIVMAQLRERFVDLFRLQSSL
jgi:hypothetical protein